MAAVRDLIQCDWEPMTHEELEQRLDRAVKEFPEGDLIERARVLVGTVFPPEHQVPQQMGDTEQPQAEGSQIVPGTGEENAAIQNSDSSYSRNRWPGRPRLSMNHAVLLSLALLSSRLSYRCVSSRIQVEKGNIHWIFFSFCHGGKALQDQLIQWPTGQCEDTHSNLINLLITKHIMGLLNTEENLQRFCSVTGLEGAKNALPKLNLELACDSRGRFIYCRISRGSDTDRAGALIEKLRLQPQMLPKDSCIIAHLGYPLRGHILTPYPTARSPKETLYNQSLEKYLKVFRRAAAELKSRFQRLQYLDMVSFTRENCGFDRLYTP
ncbi:putative nuclease HARBI1 [Scleropages formosus]|uniref:Putative nuclease HARBI1 n=1 Tax=Scleropages formosus TaxID=113540 RepID=A0A0P7W4H4_SCLFO|nr:putative nuclease HARBI1 [Scleropages formosus]